MSSIDSYYHQRLGWIRCPIDKPPRYYNLINELAIYRILEDTAQSDRLRGKKGDVFVGGGSGEWGFFRLIYPDGFRFVLNLDGDFDVDRRMLYEAVWSWAEVYALCAGFEKVGWNHKEDIETWLAERVACFAVNSYPNLFPEFDTSNVSLDWRSITRVDFEEN